MRMHSARSRTFSTNSLFAAFCLGVIGWGLLHAWGISVKTGMLFHALAAIPGTVLSVLALYRYRQHWPVNARGPEEVPGKRGRKLAWDYRAIAFYLLLAGAGFNIALFINGGSLFLLALATLGMVLVPWAKIALCRDHFFFTSALVGAGTLSGLAMPGRSVHPLHYPLAAWLLLVVACALVMFIFIIHGNRLDRMPASGY